MFRSRTASPDPRNPAAPVRCGSAAWWQVLAFPAAALMLGWVWQHVHPAGIWRSAVDPADDGWPRVEWREAGPHVIAGDWLLVDARPEAQYLDDHLPGAVSLPADAFPDYLVYFTAVHGTRRPTVVYCSSRECGAAVTLAARLKQEAGWTDVRILRGGYLDWWRARP